MVHILIFLEQAIAYTKALPRKKKGGGEGSGILHLPTCLEIKSTNPLLKSVRVHFAYGSDGRSFFVEYS